MRMLRKLLLFELQNRIRLRFPLEVSLNENRRFSMESQLRNRKANAGIISCRTHILDSVILSEKEWLKHRRRWKTKRNQSHWTSRFVNSAWAMLIRRCLLKSLRMKYVSWSWVEKCPKCIANMSVRLKYPGTRYNFAWISQLLWMVHQITWSDWNMLFCTKAKSFRVISLWILEIQISKVFVHS